MGVFKKAGPGYFAFKKNFWVGGAFMAVFGDSLPPPQKTAPNFLPNTRICNLQGKNGPMGLLIKTGLFFLGRGPF